VEIGSGCRSTGLEFPFAAIAPAATAVTSTGRHCTGRPHRAVCGIDQAHAEAIVAVRDARGGKFVNIGEVLIEVPLPPHDQEQLRERAIF
jgi:hypothetical protein